MDAEGAKISKELLQIDLQPEADEDAYDQGAEMLY